MTISITQQNWLAATTTGSQSLAFTSNVTAGNVLIAVGYTYGSGIDLNAISDSRGNAWTRNVYGGNNGSFSGIWSCVAKDSGICTVTCGGTGNYHSIGLLEVSGLDTSSLVDNTNSGSTTGTSITASITTTTPNTLLVGAMQEPGGGLTITSNNNEIGKQQNGNYMVSAAEYSIVSAAGANSLTWGINTSTQLFWCIAAYEAASSNAQSLPPFTPWPQLGPILAQ